MDYTRQHLNDSVVRLRYIPPATFITREALEETILRAINEGREASDVVSMLVMYLFTTILFPQTSGHVPVNMFHYVDTLESLRRYVWGKACYYMLKNYIPACAAWCRAQTFEKADHDSATTTEVPHTAVPKDADPSGNNIKPDAKSSSSKFADCARALIESLYSLLFLLDYKNYSLLRQVNFYLNFFILCVQYACLNRRLH